MHVHLKFSAPDLPSQVPPFKQGASSQVTTSAAGKKKRKQKQLDFMNPIMVKCFINRVVSQVKVK